MAVKLRLKRVGRTHRAVFRLSAMDARRTRDGRVLEELGTYDPTNKERTAQLKFDLERVKHWLTLGAVPSETVASLLKQQGITVR